MNRLRAWLLLWFQVSRNSIFTFGLIESLRIQSKNCLIENVQSLGTENGKLRGRWGRLSCLELILSQMMVYGLHLRKIPHILCLQSYVWVTSDIESSLHPGVAVNVRNMVASKDDTDLHPYSQRIVGFACTHSWQHGGIWHYRYFMEASVIHSCKVLSVLLSE